MAATSGTLNLVEVTKVEYADIEADAATVPTTLISFGSDEIKDGTFMLDIPEESVTMHRTEDQEVYHAYSTPSDKKATMGLVMSNLAKVAPLIGGTLTAGTAGTTPDDITFGGTPTANKKKYVKVTGLNSEGEAVTVELYRAFVTFDRTGNMGKVQAPVALDVHFNVMKHKGLNKAFSIKSAF